MLIGTREYSGEQEETVAGLMEITDMFRENICIVW